MTRFFVLSLLVLALVAGCNVYEGLYEEGESDNPDVLLEDAQIALQQNRPEAAVTHLKKALQHAEPGSLTQKRVQVNLAAAVLKTQQIDVLSFTNMVQHFVPPNARTLASSKSQSQACTFPAGNTIESFDPRGNVDFERLGTTASQEALQESQTLIASVLSGGDGAETSFSCGDVDDSVAQLQAAGMSDTEIASALVSYAVVISSLAYQDIVGSGGEFGQFYYVSPPGGTEYVGLCFTDANACINTKSLLSSNLSSIDCATRLLQKRAELLNSATATEVADIARDGYSSLAGGLGSTECIAH